MSLFLEGKKLVFHEDVQAYIKKSSISKNEVVKRQHQYFSILNTGIMWKEGVVKCSSLTF